MSCALTMWSSGKRSLVKFESSNCRLPTCAICDVRAGMGDPDLRRMISLPKVRAHLKRSWNWRSSYRSGLRLKFIRLEARQRQRTGVEITRDFINGLFLIEGH